MCRNWFIILMLFTVASCETLVEPMPKSWNWGAKPRPLNGVRNFPEANTDYGQGFRDGCGAGWDAVARGLLTDFNGKGIDPARIGSNADYSTGWFDGFEQCTYVLDWNIT